MRSLFFGDKSIFSGPLFTVISPDVHASLIHGKNELYFYFSSTVTVGTPLVNTFVTSA